MATKISIETPIDSGENWKVRRTALRLSREQLGVLAGGIGAATVARIEKDLVMPHRSTLWALNYALTKLERKQKKSGALGIDESPANIAVVGGEHVAF